MSKSEEKSAVAKVGEVVKGFLNNPGTHLVGKAAQAVANPRRVVRDMTGVSRKSPPAARKEPSKKQ